LNSISPAADLVASSAADPAKLKNGFILFTTLSPQATFLHRATSDLGWSIDGKSFRWQSLSTPLATVVLILAAKNPFGSGPRPTTIEEGSLRPERLRT
jgi:hypothetical protein